MRGDGIAIELEKNAAVNSLTINSTFQLEPLSGNTNGNAATSTGIITSVAAATYNVP